MAYTAFGPRDPETVVVTGGAQALLCTRASGVPQSVLYISNNSATDAVYIGFTSVDATDGNAAENKGITVFPSTVLEFTGEAIPWGCKVWATCAAGKTVNVGIQQ